MKEESVAMEEEEVLVESFKKLKLNTNSRYLTLTKHEGVEIEVSPVKVKMKGETMKPPKSSPKSSPKSTQPEPRITKLKGIDSMTVEELKAAMKKRRMKGLTGLRKEELVEKLKREIKSQRTLGGVKRRREVGGEEEETKEEEVHDKGLHHGEKGGVRGGVEGGVSCKHQLKIYDTIKT